MKLDTIYNKSCQTMNELPDGSIDCVITSPPYWGLRDYGVDGQLGLEPTFQLYLDHLAVVCAEVKRVLKGTGSFWLNMGDTYGGSWQDFGSRKGGQRPKSTETFRRGDSPQFYPPTARVMQKCLIGIPWRLALRLVDEQGWILRNAIIWAKPNAMPSSVKDRCSNGYEFLFHLVKQKKYYYDLDAIREPHTSLNSPAGNKQKDRESKLMTRNPAGDCFNPLGKNPGDVWTIPTQPRPEAHFATFPDALCTKPILATCPQEICRKCGKARVRIIKREWGQGEGKLYDGHRPDGLTFDGRNRICKRQTIGWTDCGCNAGFEPGIVLDPFAGRGTALIIAKKLGRHYVGYELKKEYCEELIEPVLRDIDPLFQKTIRGGTLA